METVLRVYQLNFIATCRLYSGSIYQLNFIATWRLYSGSMVYSGSTIDPEYSLQVTMKFTWSTVSRHNEVQLVDPEYSL